MPVNWNDLYLQLRGLDPRSQVTLAATAASEVLSIWEEAAPSAVRSRPVSALRAVQGWLDTGSAPDVKSLAIDAYSAVSQSGLVARPPREAALAAAHAAFALHFWSCGRHDKVFGSAHNAVDHALRACTEPEKLKSSLFNRCVSGSLCSWNRGT